MKTISLIKNKNVWGTISIQLLLICILGCTSYGSNRSKLNQGSNRMTIPDQDTETESTSSKMGDFNVEEPVTYRNLQVFPVTSSNAIQTGNYITLDEALDKNIATVIETGSVNELSITNNSDYYIFIMAGDIVKGGKQDRTMGEDYIIPPQVKKTPIKSFCVESGRWSPREEEKSSEFSSNTKVLSSKDLKLASRYEKNQSKVWSNVSNHQTKLNENLQEETGKEVEVRSAKSSSSLQLAYENEDLNKITTDYRKALSQLDTYSGKMVGYVYAINGEIYGADIFGSNILFDGLKPKLLDAIIVEAISERDKNKEDKKVTMNDVIDFLARAEKGEKQKQKVNTATDVTITDNDEMILFETTDKENEDQVIRKSYIKK